MSAPQYNKSNGRIAFWLVTAVVGMVCLAYASSPLYDLFCRTTGFAGTPLVAQEGDRPVIARTVNVRFDSNVDPNLPWRFEPLERESQGASGRGKAGPISA